MAYQNILDGKIQVPPSKEAYWVTTPDSALQITKPIAQNLS